MSDIASLFGGMPDLNVNSNDGTQNGGQQPPAQTGPVKTKTPDGNTSSLMANAGEPTTGGMPTIPTDESTIPMGNSPFAPQGNNQNDAWSTSPDWRPQAPTGGLFGSFSDLAGGAQTPYEQWIGQQYKNTADNPMNQMDSDNLGMYNWFASGNPNGVEQQGLNFYNNVQQNPFGAQGQDINQQFKNYTNTPGQAESGATQAYQNMIGSGYSPQEQAAIEGQGMRALQNQRTSSRDDMNRQLARTGQGAGYYGGISNLNYNYGQQLADQARQNQITMANEKQRRTETGAAGLGNMSGVNNARQQFGLSGQANQENTGFGRQLGATQGQQALGQSLRGYSLAGTQGKQDLSNTLFGRQQTGLQGAQGYANYGRGLQQTGLQGLSSLYGQNDPTSTWNLAAQVASKPQETYNEFGTTNGGI